MVKVSNPLKLIEVRWGENLGIVVIPCCPFKSKKVGVVESDPGGGIAVDAAFFIPMGDTAMSSSLEIGLQLNIKGCLISSENSVYFITRNLR